MSFFATGAFGPRFGYGPDSELYMQTARHPLWSRAFLAGPGPLGFPLLVKLCLRNLRAIVLVQSLCAAAAWLFLASTLASLTRHPIVRAVAFVAPLAIAVAPPVLEWNAFISTESLSLTALALTLALALRYGRCPNRRSALLLGLAFVGFGLLRDTNAYEIAFAGLVLLGVAVVRPARRVDASALGAAALGTAVVASLLSGWAQPPRWFYPLTETVSVRLLADADATRYLVDHGLPYRAEMARLPKDYYLMQVAVRDGSQFAPYRSWIRHKGQGVYVRFLATHPRWALAKPFTDVRQLLAPDVTVYSRFVVGKPDSRPQVALFAQPLPRGNAPRATKWVGELAWPWVPAIAAVWAIAAFVALVAFARRVSPAAAAVALVAAVTGVGGFMLSWHGDALEVPRHGLTAAVQFRLAVWLATILVLDAVATVWTARRTLE